MLLQINILLKACVDLCSKSVSYSIVLLKDKAPREVSDVCQAPRKYTTALYESFRKSREEGKKLDPVFESSTQIYMSKSIK